MNRIWVQRDSGQPVADLRYIPGDGHGYRDMTDRPMQTVTTRQFNIIIERTGQDRPMKQSSPIKPPYSVRSMIDIAAIPPNGYKVVSTFSGCGGSSLGYRMAGFSVPWANEFIAAARETYAMNAAPGTIIDPRDIRDIQPDDILRATDLQSGELDLFDGSPPCASFSMAGKRAKHWGKVKTYSDGSQRTDDLFAEYIRLLRGLQPKTFVAENVAGMVRGQAKGVFLDTLRELRSSGYRVGARILGDDDATNRLLVDRYYSIKKANGYSSESIEAKRKSLQGALVPLTADGKESMLRAEGFRVQQFWQSLNFAGWLAFKPRGGN